MRLKLIKSIIALSCVLIGIVINDIEMKMYSIHLIATSEVH